MTPAVPTSAAFFCCFFGFDKMQMEHTDKYTTPQRVTCSFASRALKNIMLSFEWNVPRPITLGANVNSIECSVPRALCAHVHASIFAFCNYIKPKLLFYYDRILQAMTFTFGWRRSAKGFCVKLHLNTIGRILQHFAATQKAIKPKLTFHRVNNNHKNILIFSFFHWSMFALFCESSRVLREIIFYSTTDYGFPMCSLY